MKILVSFIMLWSYQSLAGCGFKSQYSKIYSLSGPVTEILEEWKLLNVKQLKGISTFYPVPENYQGEKIAGGVFLSPGKLDEMNDAVIFFDESQELKKLFRSRKINALEIHSRNQAPGEVTRNVLKILQGYVENCSEGEILGKIDSLEKKITLAMKGKPSIVFFLGEVREGKLPELVIANDGLVLWLRKMNLITSYPSDLGYLNWSGSIIESMKEKSLFVGLKEGKAPAVIGDSHRSTLIYPGALLPGIKQLEAWNYFLDHWPR